MKNTIKSADIFNPPLPQNNSIIWSGLHGGSLSLALSNAIKHTNRPFLLLAPDHLTVSYLIEELIFFGIPPAQIIHFPDWETLPYDHFSPHQDIISERLAALYNMPSLENGVIITTINTILNRLPPPDYLLTHSFILKQGDKINLDILRTRLAHAGYHLVSQVREHGEYAIRGSIIDLFPMGSALPFRIDLFDNEAETIRTFSPETQRTLEKITEINLLPAKEYPLTEAAIEHFRNQFRSQFPGDPLKSPIYQDVSEGIATAGIEYYLPLFFEKTVTFFDYLPKSTCIALLDKAEEKAKEFFTEINLRYEAARYDRERPLLTPLQLFIDLTQTQSLLANYPQIKIKNNETGGYQFQTEAPPSLDINHKLQNPLSALKTYLNTHEGRLLFCAETMGRREVILQLFKNADIHPTYFQSWTDFLASKARLGIVVTALEEGFCLSQSALVVLTERQLYGKRVMQRRLRKKTVQDPDALIRDLTELQINDPVVHIDHGIGRYTGLTTLTVSDQIAEFLCLEYLGGDKLYVPVSSLHLISRYTGADPETVPIHKLGTDQWQRAKRRASEKVKDVAAELLDLYAKRAARPGLTFSLPEDQYAVFAAQFPFEETPDQLQAIEQVYADMTSTRPMDRVICGDVGFGKTEVALRAAFLAVQNSKQVALLVPTTLLAQQHFQNFQDRFAEWPIQVDMLSRFKTAKEQKIVLEKMAEGKVDIVIGTHKLLQNDIKFKALGLVIIDEEHRFGVKQKERLKALRSMVDILTLTATPIPRTLNMTLSGIRDLSLIATPPAKRLSVKTFVHDYQDHIIQEALLREIMRGGQVYFLHNDISTINKKAEEISKLVPEARPVIAHGQMHERELERVMSDFYHRRFNVLICSTIIESGIDIPTANTIIINRADKFGLAQLHQLRGRVGRSHHQAYAYLLIPKEIKISNDAKKRLDAIASLDELGIGFTLSTHDLEIRGAGELLGEEQSGDMQEIGFTLYMDLLSRAIDALKQGKTPDLEKTLLHQRSEVDLHLTALIPEHYLADVQLRLLFYKRIANARTVTELDEIQVEMIDRFGLLPEQLKTLFAISELKIELDQLGIIKLEAADKGGKIEFNEKPNIKPENLIRLIQAKTGNYRLDGPTRLRFTLPPHEKNERINVVRKIITELTL